MAAKGLKGGRKYIFIRPVSDGNLFQPDDN